MAVFQDIKSLTGARYNRAQYNKDLIDQYLLRRAREVGLRLPTGSEPDRINYFGAHVFTPTAGLSDHVVYLDLASLYPNTMRALNLSPETLIGTRGDLEESPYSEDDCVWGYIDTRPVKWLSKDESWGEFTDGEYKMVYDPSAPKVRWVDDPVYEKCYYCHPRHGEGFVASTVDDLIQLKYRYDGAMYEAVKRIVNSIYGFVSYATRNTSSRIYDWRMGESITLSGRKIIQHTAERAVTLLREKGYAEASVVIGDTDGCGIQLPSAEGWEDCMPDVVEVAETINEVDYPKFCSQAFGVEKDAHYMDVEVESYARRLFVPAEDLSTHDATVGSKKRYGQWMQLEDCNVDEADVTFGDMGYETVNDIDVTGFEYVRSDTADETQRLQYDVLSALLRDGEDARSEVFELCGDAREKALNGDTDLSRLAKRKGIGQPLSEYGAVNRRPSPIYRGAKYASKHLDVEIGEGDKPLVYYIEGTGKWPSTYSAETAEDGDAVDAVSLPPEEEMPEGFSIDRERHTEKVVTGPMKPILNTMNWTWSDVKSNTVDTSLGRFM